MQLTYRYRLRPTKAQRHKLNATLSLCREVYNTTLATRKEAYEERGETLGYYQTAPMLPAWKKNCPDLNQVHSQVLQNVHTRVDLAFKAFFRRVKAKREPGYPRFKGRGQYDSITYPQYPVGCKLVDGKLCLSKIGNVAIKLHRPIEGQVKAVTIQRDTLGNWYACFSSIVEAKPLPENTLAVGVDLGLKTFATVSDGTVIKRERWMKRDGKDIKRLQRKVEVCKKGSPERRKARHALRHAHKRITGRRDDFTHQESRKLSNKYQFMAFEKLDIQRMQGLGNKPINRSIADVAWGQFIHHITYKAESAGRSVVFVNPKGTTQECSRCQQVVPKDLSVRVHDCPFCGLKLDRDLNASLNILSRGLAAVGIQSEEAPGFSRGE